MTFDLPSASGSSMPLDDVPPRTTVLANLSTQSQLINQIFTSLASPSSAQQPQHQQQHQPQQETPLPLLYQLLDQTSSELLRLRKEVRAHQAVWARVDRKKREVIVLEKRTRGIMRTLEKERSELETMVREGKEVMESVGKVERDPIDIPALLSHAHGLARHSSAPVSSLLTPIDKAQYQPWPTEGAMRQGLLFQMQGSMSGVGQTGQIGDVGATDEDVVMQEQEQQAQQHREEHGRRFDPEAVFTLDLNSDSDEG